MPGRRKFYEVLTPDDVLQIHQTALRILHDVGLWLPNAEVLELLDGAGAEVDRDLSAVRIPPDVVENAISMFPPRFTWHARGEDCSLDMNGTDTYFSGPDSTLHVINLEGAKRDATLDDADRICRLCDALPGIRIASVGVHPADLPSALLDARTTMISFVHSSKAVFAPSRSLTGARLLLRMAEVVAECRGRIPDGALPIVAVCNTVSPLFNEPDQVAGMMEYIGRGVPLVISPELQAGATGPATLGGTMAQATAEFLAHATIAQLRTPGLPVAFGCVSSVFDMRKMMLPYGAPEADLLCVATAQMARYYGIPSRGTGGSSDANRLGYQAGAESLMSNLVCILAGLTYVAHAAGEMENTLATSYEKIVADHEIIRMALRMAEGIDVNSDSLALDVIKEVGPRGQFLDTEHTVRTFRAEQFLPEVLVRERFDIWEKEGRRSAEQRAKDLADQLLEDHRVEPLPAEAVRELESICSAAAEQSSR